MFSKATALLSVLASAASVLAHGHVQDLRIDGTLYRGYQPYSDSYSNPERVGWSLPSNGPVEDVTLAAIACNVDSKPGALVAPAAAGSDVTFFWSEWPESHRGPVITYLAACPSGDCRTETPTALDWFKIDHAGLTDGTWASDALIADNSTWTVTIPAEIKAGAYLLRHEILALHAAGSPNGGQFYPVCVNLEVSGSGSGVPSETVKFPGAYKATDAGILINVYYPPVTSYVIPGPAVATFGNSEPPVKVETTTILVIPVESQTATSSAAAVTSSAAAATTSSPAAAVTTSAGPAATPPPASTVTVTVSETLAPSVVTVTVKATATACRTRRARRNFL